MPNRDLEIKLKAQVKDAIADLKRAQNALKGTGESAKRAGQKAKQSSAQFSKLGKVFKGALGVTAVVYGFRRLKDAFDSIIGSYSDLEKKINEVNTLFSDGTRITEEQTDAFKKFSEQFGVKQGEQVAAYYDIISAGVTDTTESLELLETAIKAGIGGVTDTKTAADLLTSSVNAFRSQGLSAARAGDILFSTVQAGKTTFRELAASMGQVLAIANSAGLTFEELNASIAIMTANGLKTEETMTALKGILSGLLKPTDEAQKYIAALNKRLKDGKIEFNTTSLRAKGLSKFLREIVDASQGSVDILTKLFPKIRGLTGILTLASVSTEDFEEAIKKSTESVGALDKAFEKMVDNIERKEKIASAKWDNLKIVWGDALKRLKESTLESKTSIIEFLDSISKGLVKTTYSIYRASQAFGDFLFTFRKDGLSLSEIRKKFEKNLEKDFDNVDKIFDDRRKKNKKKIKELEESIALEQKNRKLSQDEKNKAEEERVQKILKNLGLKEASARKLFKELTDEIEQSDGGKKITAEQRLANLFRLEKKYNGMTIKQLKDHLDEQKELISKGSKEASAIEFQFLNRLIAKKESENKRSIKSDEQRLVAEQEFRKEYGEMTLAQIKEQMDKQWELVEKNEKDSGDKFLALKALYREKERELEQTSLQEKLAFEDQYRDAKKAELEERKALLEEQVKQGKKAKEDEYRYVVGRIRDILREEEQSTRKKEQLAEKEKKAKEDAISGVYGNVKSSLRALFGENKAVASAIAVTDGLVAVQKALASAPPPWNFASAASVGAVTAANVKDINSINVAKRGVDEVKGFGSSDNVPFMLTAGERVVPKETNKDLKKFLSNMKQGANSDVNVNVNLNKRELGKLIDMQIEKRTKQNTRATK